MLTRICPYTLRGFLYYQGESDDHRPETYAELLEALILRWRSDWGDDALPFLNVQLPMFRYANEPDKKHWCRIREAQMQVYRKLRHTGLAVLTDCGELDNIHPVDKAPVAHRLYLQAMSEVYHLLPRAAACAPAYRESYASGRVMNVYCDHAANGWMLKGEPTGFELAGADGEFYPAAAAFAPGCITLTAKAVAEPRFARYAWSNYTEVTVFGRNGLPLAPFRTF